MLATAILFFLSAAAIYWACEYFVNGVEWLGKHLKMGAMAVGAVLAAFGTALPESCVTLFAVLSGRGQVGKDLGVGAALGGPLALSTLAYAITGLALVWNHKSLGRVGYATQVNQRVIGRDQFYFLLIFSVKLLLGLFAFPFKGLCGWLFLAVYLVYVVKKVNGGEDPDEENELEPLRLRRGQDSTLGWAAAQTFGALAIIAFASHIFVAQLGAIGAAFHWPPQMTALLLSPVATELPEILNAIIWVRQGKEKLALANISGAMMIQATVPSAIGLFFTPWIFDRALTISALTTMAAIIFLWSLFRRPLVDARLLSCACLFYALFTGLLVHNFNHRWEAIPEADRLRPNPEANSPETLAAGAESFRLHCQRCHEAAGRGGDFAPPLRSERLRQATDGQIEWLLRQGVSEKGMPSWVDLPRAERWRIAAYLKSIQ